MADTQRKNLLRDLASAARRAQEVREMSPARALRLGLARAAAQLYELPVQVTEVKSTGLGGEEVAAACGPDMLLALLDGPDGARGAVALNRAMVAALIEVQVMGVVSTLELSDRALTPTDAAMVAPWLDAALERVDLALAEGLPVGTGPDCGKAGDWLVGYRFGAMAEDEGHHPAILTEWGKVTVTWWSHKIKGLHVNDFIMCAKCDSAHNIT